MKKTSAARAAALALLLLLGSPGWAAILPEGIGSGAVTSATLTFSVQCGTNAQRVIVVSAKNNSNAGAQSVTYATAPPAHGSL